MTRHEYWTKIRETIREAVEDLDEEMKNGYITTEDEANDWLYDRIREETYPGDCEDVMNHTDNADAISEFDPDFTGKSWRDICNDFAVWAHQQDLMDYMPDRGEIEEMLEKYQEEDEDDEEYTEEEEDEVRAGTWKKPEPEEEPEFDRLRRFFFPKKD